MMAIAIMGISMTFISYDSRYTSSTIYQFGQKDNMLYAGQSAIEKYKLDKAGGTEVINGYSIDINVTNNQTIDPNLTNYLTKVTFIVHPKSDDINNIDSLILNSYVFTSATVSPDAPINLVATASASGIVLTWNVSVNATTYNVKKSITPGGPYTTISSGGGPNTYTDIAVVSGVTYYYVVSAVNPYGESANSNEASASIIINTITLSPIADSYVENSIFSGFNFGTQLHLNFGTTNFFFFTFNYKSYLKFDLSTIPGAITSASLKLNGNNNSSGTLNADIHSLTDDSWTEPGITWNNAPTEGNVLNTITFTSTPQYVASDVTNYCQNEYAGNKLTSFVVTTSSNALGLVSSRESASPPQLIINYIAPPPPLAPQGLTAVPGDKQVTLTWAPSATAIFYNIKRSTVSGGPYTTIQSNIIGTSYIDTNPQANPISNGTTYYYVVSAVNTGGESNNSNEASAIPNIITTVTYSPIADAYVHDGSYADMNFGSVANLQVLKGTVGNNILSYFKFDLSNLRGDIISAKIRLYGSNITDATSVNMGYYSVGDITWQENSITYNNAPIYGSQIGSVPINNTQSYWETDITSYITSVMSSTKIPDFAAVAIGLNKQLSFNSKESLLNQPQLVITKTLLAPLPPTNLSAVPNNQKVNLSWTASDETNSYSIYRSTVSGGPYTIVATGITTTAYTDTTVTNGTTYYYVVKAVNAAGTSAYSNEVNATPTNVVTITLNPVADAMVDSYYTTKNYGTSTSLSVVNNGSENQKSYLRFDLTGYTGYTINSAMLKLYGKSVGGALAMDAYAVSDSSWIESGTGSITWSNSPSMQSQIGAVSVGSTSQYYQIDVTKYVQPLAQSTNLISLGMYSNNISAISGTFNSREAVSNKPQLTLIMTQGLPLAPTNLTAVGGNKRVTLSWTASVGATGYNVYKSTTKGGPYNIVNKAPITGTGYTDTKVSNNTQYFYVVTAINANGSSIYSNEASAKPSSSGTTVTLLPVGDTYVDSSVPYSNFGGNPNLYVSAINGNNQNGYIMFDLSSLSPNPKSATLTITGQTNPRKGNPGLTVQIWQVTNDLWDEYTMNWVNRPSDGASLASITINKLSRSYNINVLRYLKNKLSGDKKLGVSIKAVTSNLSGSFSSKEGSSAPVLIVTY